MLWYSILSLLTTTAALQLPIPHNPDSLGSLSSTGPISELAKLRQDDILVPASDISLTNIGEEFMTITSAHYPKHRIRIKSTEGWCDPTVRSFSGFLDVGYGKELFFYFFESRNEPSSDPVVMWINGGPGCSSALGLFMELGPCSVKDDPKNWNDTEWNPYSWNNNANVFFLDEPISVGFSHAKHGQTVGTTEEAAKDVQAFVAMFFDAFKEFEGRDFHMAGESYGGRYLPVFASAVVDGNKALKASGRTPINLKSVMIGNGGTEYQTLSESYYTFQCTLHGGLNETVQSIQKCVELASAVPKCHKYLQKNCIDSHDYTECGMAALYCDEALGDSFVSAGVNPYDVSKPCTPQELGESLCYSVTDKIKTYLDLPDVHDILGVTSHKGWNSCNGGVGTAFALTLDFLTPTTVFHVRGLLERGIRFLNYAGTYDFICNHIANEMWVSAMDWTGKEGFAAVSWQDWEVEGKKAGLFKTYENLTLLKIVGAGHMVPYDKPKEALTMLSSWLQAGL